MDTTGQEHDHPDYEAREKLKELEQMVLSGRQKHEPVPEEAKLDLSAISDKELKEELRRRGVVEEIIVDHSDPLSAFGKLPRAQQEQLRKALKREMGAAMGIGMIEKFKNHIWEEDRLITDVKVFHLKFEFLVK